MAAAAEQLVFASVSVVCAGIASFYDVRERRIPNALTGAALLVGSALHLAVGGWSGFGASVLAALTAGGLFLIFFLAGGMGAGDVKLMAAVGCITGFAPLQLLLLATVLSGGIFALALALYRGKLQSTCRNLASLISHHGSEGLKPHPVLNLGNERALRLPFALPIAAGCLVTLCTLARGARL